MSKIPMPRLGKGLESLIPRTAMTSNRGVTTLFLNEIVPNEYQPRLHFNEEALQQLSLSIKTHGLAQPVIVRKKDTGYELIAGERRFRASKLAGLTTIPAIIKEVSDKEALQLALVENIDREDLNAIEEARAYQRLINEFEMTHQRVSEVFCRSRSAITNTLRLLQLPESLQNEVIKGSLSEGHARVLLSLPDADKMWEVAELIKAHGWSVRETERYISEHKGPVPVVEKAAPVQQIGLFSDLELQLSQALGVSVNVKGSPKKGSVQLKFTSQAQLESILSLLRAQHLIPG